MMPKMNDQSCDSHMVTVVLQVSMQKSKKNLGSNLHTCKTSKTRDFKGGTKMKALNTASEERMIYMRETYAN